MPTLTYIGGPRDGALWTGDEDPFRVSCWEDIPIGDPIGIYIQDGARLVYDVPDPDIKRLDATMKEAQTRHSRDRNRA